MWKVLVDQQVLHIMIGVISGFGMLAELLMGLRLAAFVRRSMVKDPDHCRFIKEYEEETKQICLFGKNVYDVDNYVEKYVNKQKLMGIFLYTWERICGQAAIVSGFIALISAGLTIYYKCGQKVIQNEIFLDSFLCILWITIMVLSDRNGQKKILYKNLKEYIQELRLRVYVQENKRIGQKEVELIKQAERQLIKKKEPEIVKPIEKLKKVEKSKKTEKEIEADRRKQELAEEIRLQREKREKEREEKKQLELKQKEMEALKENEQKDLEIKEEENQENPSVDELLKIYLG